MACGGATAAGARVVSEVGRWGMFWVDALVALSKGFMLKSEWKSLLTNRHSFKDSRIS